MNVANDVKRVPFCPFQRLPRASTIGMYAAETYHACRHVEVDVLPAPAVVVQALICLHVWTIKQQNFREVKVVTTMDDSSSYVDRNNRNGRERQ